VAGSDQDAPGAEWRSDTVSRAVQGEGRGAVLPLVRQLVGNNDEVTDLRFVGGPAGAPTHVAVATNSEQVRLFHAASLSCSASLLGHSDTVLCLDAAPLGDDDGGRWLLVSGAKDNTVRLWEAPSGRCLGERWPHARPAGCQLCVRVVDG
jgi:U3 small nucleolar RNA-associated protein 13